MKSVDLMIDLETLGTDPDCVVLSIGACVFDFQKKKIVDKFYIVLDTEDQKNCFRTVDQNTLKWWSQQSNQAKKVFTEPKEEVREALDQFVQFILRNGTISQIKPWGNGSTFDISILESLFKDYEVKVPWLFYNVMDLRTFVRFQGKGDKVPKLEGVNHHALDDAINQANYVMSKL